MDTEARKPASIPLWGKALIVCAAFVLQPILKAISPYGLQQDLCPPSTFYHDIFGSSGELIVAPLTMAFPPVILIGMYWTRLTAIFSSQAIEGPKPVSNIMKVITLSLVCILIGAVYLYIDLTRSYYCLSKDGVTLRRGLASKIEILPWSRVKNIYGLCGMTKQSRYGQPYKFGMILLDLQLERSLKVELSSRDSPITDDYKNLKHALIGQTYTYYVNNTVAPESCPPGMFDLLWYWPSRNS